MPSYRSYPSSKLEPTEAEIELAIGHYLRVKGFCFWKQNTRGFYDTRIKKFKKDQNPYAWTGLPDYAVLYRGFHCGLEVKKRLGKQSESQKLFEEFMKEKGGAFYFVVKSVECVEEAMTKFKGHVDSLYEKTHGPSH